MSNTGSRRPQTVSRFRRRNTPEYMKMKTPDEESNPTQNEVRLVLLGKTGAGKSASGNTIFNEDRFKDKVSMASVTKECKGERGTVEGRNLLLVDTPGLFDTDLTDEDLQHQLIRCLTLSSPGPHVFLLVIPIERYTQEQQETVKKIKDMFQHDITDRTIIVFSHADRLEGEFIEKFLLQQNEKVQELVEMFGRRYVAFNNKDRANRDQVCQLLERVDELMCQHENTSFSNDVTEVMLKAQTIIDERIKEEIQKEADQRWALFTAHMNQDRQDSEKMKKRVKARIHQIEADMSKENQNEEPITARLKRMEESLEMEKMNLNRIQSLEKERVMQERNEKKNKDLWIEEEQQRRKSLKTENDPDYTKMIVYLTLLMLGLGIGSFAPVLLSFLFPAVPAVAEAGLAAQILAKMLTLVPVTIQIATLSRCTIQ